MCDEVDDARTSRVARPHQSSLQTRLASVAHAGEPHCLRLVGDLGALDVIDGVVFEDAEFDRAHGLRSIPVRFGIARALMISRAMHVVAVIGLLALAWVTPLPPLYSGGVAVIALMLVYEQSLVHANDLSQVKRAFDLNGYVGILYLLVLAVSLYVA